MGGGEAPKPTKAKIGGTRINCIDANKSQASHGGKFEGKTNGSGNGMGNMSGSQSPGHQSMMGGYLPFGGLGGHGGLGAP